MNRLALVSGLVALAVTIAACGGSLSLTEYADQLEEFGMEASDRFNRAEAVLFAPDATLEEARSALATTATIRREFHDQLEGLDPPEQMAELHSLLIESHADIVEAQQAWADTAPSADSVEELLTNTEAEVFRTIGAIGLEVCRELQKAFDSTKERAALEGTPWLPAEMQETVEVAFGCG